MCSECGKNYSKITDFECGRCPSDKANIIRFIFISLALILVIIIMVRSSF